MMRDADPARLQPVIAAILARALGLFALSAGTPDDAHALMADGRAALGTGPEMQEVWRADIPTRGGTLPAFSASGGGPARLVP